MVLSSDTSFAIMETPLDTFSSLTRRQADNAAGNKALQSQGIGIVSFFTAFVVAIIIFSVQTGLFLLLRNKLARIFKPKTYLVPERERIESPPPSLFGLAKTLLQYPDREIIKKCGLDAYFFLRYLRTLLVVFIPICLVVLPILVSLNYIDGKGKDINATEKITNRHDNHTVIGLDTLAWGNVKSKNADRYTAHLVMAILVIIWVCTVFFFELRVYVKVRQDYLTSAQHRLRASATTVLVNEIPAKWLSEEALRGLFDVFPGGVRNIWLNRDLSVLLEKIELRDKIHLLLEQAETDLIKNAKKAQLKQRTADEKRQRRETKQRRETRDEKAARDALEDAQAKEMANSGQGTHAGSQIFDDRLNDDEGETQSQANGRGSNDSKGMKFIGLGNPLVKVGQGIIGVVGKAGSEVDEKFETTNGFGLVPNLDRQAMINRDLPQQLSPDSLNLQATHSLESTDSTKPIQSREPAGFKGNTVRKLININELYDTETPKFWQFWKPPAGGFASPVPQGQEAADYMLKERHTNKTAWQRFKEMIPFIGPDIKPMDYEVAFNKEQKHGEDEEAVWAKYLKKKDRPTHNLPLFGIQALPGLPFITKKVDTIYWCREELARLNVEIEADQKEPERYPLMRSAFIQFEHQVGAHMACQSTMHHVPQHMTPRIIEISPRDVLWDNMNLSWWQQWMRTVGVVLLIVGMVLLWAIPVAFTASLSQLDDLIQKNEWLSFLKANDSITTVATAVAGVLPALLLALLLILVPILLDFLAGFRGSKTGAQKSEFVQVFYFLFLFVQVFLIVSIASFFAASLTQLIENIQHLESVTAVLDLLAQNLPQAGNYFFTYMILQALSTSSGTLLQIGTLIVWYVIGPMFDSTARSKWSRNTKLNNVNWGAFFPIYTNFACIGIIYSVIAPLISVFAVITFSLLWVAHRYSMIYVTRFEFDTGGVLYPRAINQTFTGIYFMELCLAGLFFIVEDEKGANACTAHGIIMLVVLILTILYQVGLNSSFSPLLRYLPITYEDEAVLRDQAFERAQRRKFGLEDSDRENDYNGADGEMSPLSEKSNSRVKSIHAANGEDIEMNALQRNTTGLGIRNPVRQVGAWAKGGGNQIRKITATDRKAIEYRQQKRQNDLEKQRKMGEALYGGLNDDIEDLTPDERDRLVCDAFRHAALRARRPTVWIPRDDMGISDDEIRRTQAYSNHISISNEGTALDSKVRVVYGQNPPDFSEVDVMIL